MTSGRRLATDGCLKATRLAGPSYPAGLLFSNPTRSSELLSTYRAAPATGCVAPVELKVAILRPRRIKLDSIMVGDTTDAVELRGSPSP